MRWYSCDYVIWNVNLLADSLTGFDEARCHVVNYAMERPPGKQLKADSGEEPERNGNTQEELNPANNHMSLEADSSPVRPLDQRGTFSILPAHPQVST